MDRGDQEVSLKLIEIHRNLLTSHLSKREALFSTFLLFQLLLHGALPNNCEFL